MRYAVRKAVTLLMTMLIVSFLAFLAFELVTGDAAIALLGTNATPERLEALREELGLNRPFLIRYGSWLAGFFTGDLGMSFGYKVPVSELVGQKLPATLALSIMSFVLIVAASIPLGLWSVRWEGRKGRLWQSVDVVRTTFNQLFMSIPAFFSGILISWVFGILLSWFRPGGAFPTLAEPGRFFWNLLFPAVAIAIPRVAMTVRMLRSTIVYEMNSDYVRTAISRGNDRPNVLWRHVLRNALAPVVAFLAQTMAEVVAGSIVVEQVFGVPGLGRLLLACISNRDWPVVQSIIVILAFWVVLAGTLGDLVSQRIDPRLRLGGDRE